MMELITRLLDVDEFIAKSPTIDIAKGKNKLCTSFKEARKQYKRRKAWRQT